ncbi:MAG: hypothetical protein L3J79_02790 [Candidatus Marinimicrobia bacterium]|nr:hypothetical protein [Candidatus Neomarinimicrobiota bacterium]
MKTRKLIKYIKQPFEVRLLRYLVFSLIVTPVIMVLSWFATPDFPMDIFVLNKSVPDSDSQNQLSLFWVLNNEKITKSDGNKYSRGCDYYGFYPLAADNYLIKDISNYSKSAVDSLAETIDAVYFADTYGVYYNDFFAQPQTPNRLLYGGLYERDLDLLEAMKVREKLIIAEFNILGESTPPNARRRFLKEFGLLWTGWSGRYFDSLDSTKGAGVPAWIFDLHRKQTGKSWPYIQSGLVLVSSNDDIIILESGSLLERKVPVIQTRPFYQEKFHVPAEVNYISWFDMVFSPTRENTVVSTFHLPVTEAGDSVLAAQGLSPVFPAVLADEGPDYRFYYFAGDFSRNEITPVSAYFKWIHWFQSFLYNSRNVLDTRSFFWQYYRPLTASILKQDAVD